MGKGLYELCNKRDANLKPKKLDYSLVLSPRRYLSIRHVCAADEHLYLLLLTSRTYVCLRARPKNDIADPSTLFIMPTQTLDRIRTRTTHRKERERDNSPMSSLATTLAPVCEA